MPSQKQALERCHNLASILHALRQGKPMTRQELMKQLSLSWGCVFELTDLLLRDGILSEEKATGSAKGRTPTLLSLSPHKQILGVDVNKIGLSFCVCDFFGKPIRACTLPLQTEKKQDVLTAVWDGIQAMRAQFPHIAAIGIALQGMSDKKRSLWHFPTKDHLPIDISNDLVARLDLPCLVEHDPNCMLFEWIEHSNRESKMLVRLDSGIGAAIYKGGHHLKTEPLELGYTVVDHRGERLSSVLEQCNALSKESMERFGSLLGIALGNFCNMIALDEIILCGDFTQYQHAFLPSVQESYVTTTIPSAQARITVKDAKNASLGAAKLALAQFPYLVRTKEL